MSGTTTCNTCGQANGAESEYCVRCGTRMPDPSSTQLVDTPGSSPPEYPWEPPAEWDPGELPAAGSQPPAQTWVAKSSDQVGWNTGQDTGSGTPWSGSSGQGSQGGPNTQHAVSSPPQPGIPPTQQHQQPRSKKPIFIAVGAVVIIAAIVLGIVLATGGKKSTALNGVQTQSGTDALTTTRAALRGAKSAHLTGTVKSSGSPVRIDLTLAGPNSEGTLTINNNDVQLIKVGGSVFIKGDQDFLKQYAGNNAAALNALNGKWLKAASTSDFDAFSLDGFANALKGGSTGSTVNPKVDRSTLDGKPVVIISESDGSTLTVANTGPAYPLVVDSKTSDGGQVTFSDYNKAVSITAPPSSQVLDLSTLAPPTPTPTITPSASAALSSDDIAGSYDCKPPTGTGGGTLFLNSDFSYTLKNTNGTPGVGGSWGSSGTAVAFVGGNLDKYAAVVQPNGDLILKGSGTNSAVTFTCS